jgi:hypothetical protein
MLALMLCVAAPMWTGGCDNWPIQEDAGRGGGSFAPNRRALSTTCWSYTPITPSPSAQVNGALCFGIALRSTTGLQCLPVAEGVVRCQDIWEEPFEARWSGGLGVVKDSWGKRERGTVQQIQDGVFEVMAGDDDDSEGLCTITTSPSLTAKYCLYE